MSRFGVLVGSWLDCWFCWWCCCGFGLEGVGKGGGDVVSWWTVLSVPIASFVRILDLASRSATVIIGNRFRYNRCGWNRFYFLLVREWIQPILYISIVGIISIWWITLILITSVPINNLFLSSPFHISVLISITISFGILVSITHFVRELVLVLLLLVLECFGFWWQFLFTFIFVFIFFIVFL